jgi:hypothetical protein
MALADVTATFNVQGITGDLEVDDLQRLWLNGVVFGDNVPSSSFQDSTNFTDDSDELQAIVRNVKFLTGSTAEVDVVIPTTYGSASIYGVDVYGGSQAMEGLTQQISLPVPHDYCQLRVHLDSTLPIHITSARFYAYDGIDDATPYRGLTFYAAEGDISTSWIAANGSSQALICQNQALASTHDFYIALSASPTDTGDKQGKFKFVFTYSQS